MFAIVFYSTLDVRKLHKWFCIPEGVFELAFIKKPFCMLYSKVLFKIRGLSEAVCEQMLDDGWGCKTPNRDLWEIVLALAWKMHYFSHL